MRTVEWDGTRWVLVEWKDIAFLQRKGTILISLASRAKVNAECEAMLLGWL
jgi:hypothetical protein